jgi:hypothetical protein
VKLSFRTQGAEHLVGGDVEEAEALPSPRPSSDCQYPRAASSIVNVPTTFVWMKSAGPSMERSTWDSAARCITAVGRCSRITRAIASPLQMSSSTK